jgi:putative membrane protein
MISLLLATCTCRGYGWFPFPFFPLIFFPLWIFVFILVNRRWRRGWSGQSGESVLSERYARGEIDAAEFVSRRNVLRRKD